MITPQMRVLVAVEPVDGCKGIESLARLCQDKLVEDPFPAVGSFFAAYGRETMKSQNFRWKPASMSTSWRRPMSAYSSACSAPWSLMRTTRTRYYRAGAFTLDVARDDDGISTSEGGPHFSDRIVRGPHGGSRAKIRVLVRTQYGVFSSLLVTTRPYVVLLLLLLFTSHPRSWRRAGLDAVRSVQSVT